MMGSFNDFASIYEHLEENGMNYKYPHQIGELFKNLRDQKHQEEKNEEAKKAQWEIDFFSFGLNDNRLSPKFTATDEKGEVIEYPTLNRFDERTYAYLIERFNVTRSPLTKARYSHLLWLSPKKHLKYAKAAIDSYLELVEIYEKKDMDKPEGHYGLDAKNAIRNAFFIGREVKY
jgi:CHAT domain-containing protein